ncbi:helix-turn-helix transcriptional regulator [Plantibacter sp. CFBP 8775]|uniref:helix-turn-helix transcriptional regulator n=1 Tax=Plantibacter sp. CFBP 8775 TaxID=2774038 RepID=UPI0017852AAB|nr:helix-turn-helix transcriptional regulator [Plantibacter sp. CFBP 8775]MBD8103978.1 helix-turn-helix transcriptional regulator [Plantibacter sp. CFBP 8775]
MIGRALRNAWTVARRRTEQRADWALFAQQFATSLRAARERRSLTQEDVAYRAGLTRYTYQMYEKGESRPGTPVNPSLRSLLGLAQALDVSLSDLIPDDAPDLRRR